MRLADLTFDEIRRRKGREKEFGSTGEDRAVHREPTSAADDHRVAEGAVVQNPPHVGQKVGIVVGVKH